MPGGFNQLKDLIRNGEVGRHELRFFVGYSGWVPNQLKGEIKDNCWLVSDIETTE